MYHRQKIAFKYFPTQFSHGTHTFYMKWTQKSIKNEQLFLDCAHKLIDEGKKVFDHIVTSSLYMTKGIPDKDILKEIIKICLGMYQTLMLKMFLQLIYVDGGYKEQKTNPKKLT